MKITFLLLLTALLTGCDSMSTAQYLVRPTALPSDSTFVVQSTDKSLVAETLAAVATASADFRDISSESKVPHTIAAYEEKAEHFPISFGARLVGDVIVVDICQFHPGTGDLPPFKSVKEAIRAKLASRFGSRLTEPVRGKQIPFGAEPANGT